MKIKKILNAPFPFVGKSKDIALLSLFFGVFIFVFLITFQPFGVSNVQFYKPLFVLGYGGITFFVILFSFFIYPKLNPHFDSEKWTLKKMLLFIFLQVLLTSILNWIYTSIVGKEIMEQHSLVKFVFITFSVGVIPVSFSLLVLERFLSWRNEIIANKLTSSDFIIKSESANVKIGNKQNVLSVPLSKLLCIKANGNYVDVYVVENTLVKKHLIRCTLLKIKQQLEAYNQIKHCHRSFIVNTQHLINITGNARNFNLHLRYLDFIIPVSRSFPINTIKK